MSRSTSKVAGFAPTTSSRRREAVALRGRRRRVLATTAAIVLAGLALRAWGPGLGLPFAATKYGGSALWGAMVYGIAAAMRPAAPPRRVAAAALTAATLVELFRLVHAPWLDAFRLTAAGALLLGRVFSPWNVAAYAAGIAVAWLAERPRRGGRLTPPRRPSPGAGPAA